MTVMTDAMIRCLNLVVGCPLPFTWYKAKKVAYVGR